MWPCTVRSFDDVRGRVYTAGMSPDQIFSVPVTPAQRYLLLSFTRHPQANEMIKSAEDGAAYRRFLTALGLDLIVRAANQSRGAMNATMVNNHVPARFTLTLENVGVGLWFAKIPRSLMQEEMLGDLFDAFSVILNLKRYEAPAGMGEFDAAADMAAWLPPAPPPPDETPAEVPPTT